MELKEASSLMRKVYDQSAIKGGVDLSVTAETLLEAFRTVIESAEAVEHWRGKLPDRMHLKRIIMSAYRQDGDWAGKVVDRIINDCAAAYVANFPTVEELRAIINDNFNAEICAQDIHDLIVGKVRGK